MRGGALLLVACGVFLAIGCGRGDEERYSEAPPLVTTSEPTPRAARPSDCPEVGEDGELIHPVALTLLVSVDETHIYYSVYDPPAIHRVRKDGSGPTEMVGPYDRAIESALIKFDGTSVFWMVTDPVTGVKSILQVDKGTLEVARRYELPPRLFWDYAMDAEYFYAVGIGCENPVRVSRETGEVREIEYPTITAGGTTSLLVDEAHLYCANTTKLVRMPRSMTNAPEVIMEGEWIIGGLSERGSDLIWSEHSPGRLQRMSKGTLEVFTDASSELDVHIYHDALHRDHSNDCLYFLANLSACNTLAYHCPGDEKVAILTSGVEHDQVKGGFAIDEEYYYWTTRQGIRRKPKPER